MHEAVCVFIGLFVGGIVGVVTMCLVQVNHCKDCPHRKSVLNRGGR